MGGTGQGVLFANPLPVQRRPSKPLPLGVLRPTGWHPPERWPTLNGVKQLAIDVETCDPDINELGPGVRRGAFICGIAIGLDLDGPRCYFPIRHEGGGNLDPTRVIPYLREEFKNFTGDVVGAGLQYDLDFLAEEDLEFPNAHRFHDVQVAEPLLDEHRLRYGLEYLSQDYLGIGKDETILRKAAERLGASDPKLLIWRLPADHAGDYAEADVDRPLRILELQKKKLDEEGLLRVFDLESRLLPILVAMRRRGVRVDLDRAQRLRVSVHNEINTIIGELKRITGKQLVLTENEALGKALESIGLPVPRTPKRGAPTVNKPFMEKHEDVPAVKLIMRGRALEVLKNTFIDGHILGHHVKGRIHATFNQLKGDTGGTIARMSSADPNLQNIPARDEDLGPKTRAIFLPEEGEEWESQDSSQVEYRFLAHDAIGPGAEEARRMYINDPTTDFHKMCADMMGVDRDDKIKRKRVKNVNFAKFYGAQAKKLAITMNCTVEEAEKFISEYEERLPFTVDTFREFDRLAQRKGFIKTILGRRQRFPFWEPKGARGGMAWVHGELVPVTAYPTLEAAQHAYPGLRLQRASTYTALNRRLQGGAADHHKKALVDLKEAGIYEVLGVPLTIVHDEDNFSMPKTKVGEEAVLEAKRIIENAVKLKVPLMVKREHGPSWGECK